MRRTAWPLLLACCLFWSWLPAAAAANGEPSTDDLFEQARALAYDGDREAARVLLFQALERSPDYHDVRQFLGRTYMWDKRWEDARGHLERVVAAQPTNAEARLALIDVELWTDYPERALKLADEGVAIDPFDGEFHVRRARALRDLERFPEALAAAKRASTTNPESIDAVNRLVRDLEPMALPFKLSFVASREEFRDDALDPWTEAYVQLGHRRAWGSIYYRANFARRFNRDDQQFEVDAYPKLGSGRYLYLNAGVSGAEVYPEWRLGGEIYQSLPKSWEASLGFRHLSFESSDVTLYTGSIGRYRGAYFIWVRPYFSDKGSAGTSLSTSLFVRRFLGNRYSYVTVSGGSGETPDEDLSTSEITQLDSTRFMVEAQKLFKGRWIWKAKLGYRTREVSATNERRSWVFGAGLEWLF